MVVNSRQRSAFSIQQSRSNARRHTSTFCLESSLRQSAGVITSGGEMLQKQNGNCGHRRPHCQNRADVGHPGCGRTILNFANGDSVTKPSAVPTGLAAFATSYPGLPSGAKFERPSRAPEPKFECPSRVPEQSLHPSWLLLGSFARDSGRRRYDAKLLIGEPFSLGHLRSRFGFWNGSDAEHRRQFFRRVD